MAQNPFSVSPEEMKRLRQTYQGRTTKPTDMRTFKVDARPRAKPQPKLEVAQRPSAGSTAQSMLGMLKGAPEGVADLAVSIPTAAYDYIRTSTPGEVASDIKSGVGRFADYFSSNPLEALVEMSPAGGAKDAGEMLREAALARDAGDEERAAQIEKFVVPMMLASLVPGGRAAKGAERMAVREGVEAAERGVAREIADEALAVPAKKTTKKAEVAAAPNPTQIIAEEYSPETARRVRAVVGPDAPIEDWRAAAAGVHGTQSNRAYQPENDLAFRDFDLGTYGMRKTIDQPRLFDLDVERQRWSPQPQTNTLYFQDLVGRPYMTGMADRTPSGTTITRIGPTELDIPVKEHGGQDYMLDYPYSWGVSTRGVSSNFMNTARRLKQEFGVNPIWVPWRMQGPGSDFSKTTGETMMSYANSALGGDTRRAMDRFIKENYIPDFAGIGDPRGYLQFGELAGPQRKAMEDALGRNFAEEGGLSLPLTRAIITDPNQLDRKAFHVQNVAEIDPDAEVVVKPLNPTYHYNTPGAYEGTLEPGLQDSLNVAELVAPTLRAKYSDLGDLSVFRGQNAPLSPENLADQMAQYEDLKAAFDARVAAGDTKAKPPRKPVPIGGTNKFMQSVFATGFLNDRAAQALYDKLVAAGARIK